MFIQASWASLRTEFAALKPAQLHHMLSEYSAGKACPSGWSPSPSDAEGAIRTGELGRSKLCGWFSVFLDRLENKWAWDHCLCHYLLSLVDLCMFVFDDIKAKDEYCENSMTVRPMKMNQSNTHLNTETGFLNVLFWAVLSSGWPCLQ